MTQKRTSTKVSAFLLALMMLMSTFVFTAQTSFADYEGEWYYTVEDGKATIQAYIGISDTITVPSKVGGYPVKAVWGLANVSHKTKVTAISLSSGITEIGPSAFDGYTSLQRVTLPAGLKKIGNSAFANCTKLGGINLPSSVESIGASAFQGCTALTSANIQCGIAEIPSNLFSGCKVLGNVTMPNYITAIGDLAFFGCETLANITIPDTVKTIGDSAFYGCKSLKAVHLPADLTKLGDSSFHGCAGLTKMYIPSKTRHIGEEVFRGCSSLAEIYISPSVTKIGSDTFVDCSKLTKLVFGGDYVNVSNTFGVVHTPMVYYPSTNADTWERYISSNKSSYAPSTKISIKDPGKLTVGASVTLKVTNYPSNAVLSGAYFFTSNNKAVATVDDNGVVSAKKAGTATITVTAVNGVSSTIDISIKPKAVTGVKATPATINSVTVSWKDNGAAGYYIYRCDTQNGKYKYIGKAAAGSTSYADKGLTKGKTYYYKVVAYQTSTLLSSYSASAKVTVSAPTPTGVKVTKNSNTSATIKWNRVAGANGYIITMATSKNGKYSTIKTITNASTVSFKKTGLEVGGEYFFKVWSYITVSGKKVYSPASGAVSVSMSVASPDNVVAKKASDNSVKLTWDRVNAADGYVITMSTKANGKYSTIKTITNSSTEVYTKYNLVKGNTYYFKVWSYVTVNGAKEYGSAPTYVSVKL